MKTKPLKRPDRDEEIDWLPLADMMNGLMVVFLFLAVALMRAVQQEHKEYEEKVALLSQTQDEVFAALQREFKEEDLKKWDAHLEREALAVRFDTPDVNGPHVLFASQSATLTPRFRDILDDFFPRYVNTLDRFSPCVTSTGQSQNCPGDADKPRGYIEEVRIEGHTSREWAGALDENDAYNKNMALSQERTRAVLQYSMTRIDPARHQWLRRAMAAIGFSSSRPVIRQGHAEEDAKRSRRVEFRVITTIEKQLLKVVQEHQ